MSRKRKRTDLVLPPPAYIYTRTNSPDFNIFPTMSVQENLEMGAFLDRRAASAQLDKVFGWFPILKQSRRRRAGTLSGGQRLTLGVGRALMTDPSLVTAVNQSENRGHYNEAEHSRGNHPADHRHGNTPYHLRRRPHAPQLEAPMRVPRQSRYSPGA